MQQLFHPRHSTSILTALSLLVMSPPARAQELTSLRDVPPEPSRTWNGYDDARQLEAYLEKQENISAFQRTELGRLFYERPALFNLAEGTINKYGGYGTDLLSTIDLAQNQTILRREIGDAFREDLRARGLVVNWDAAVDPADYIVTSPEDLLVEMGKDLLFGDFRSPGEQIDSALQEQALRPDFQKAQQIADRFVLLGETNPILRQTFDRQFWPVLRSDLYRDYAVPGVSADRAKSVYERRLFEERWSEALESVKSMQAEHAKIRAEIDALGNGAEHSVQRDSLQRRADDIMFEVNRASAVFAQEYEEKYQNNLISLLSQSNTQGGSQSHPKDTSREVLEALEWIDTGATLLSRINPEHAVYFSKISKTAVAAHGLIKASGKLDFNPYLSIAKFAINMFSIFAGGGSDPNHERFLLIMENIDRLRTDLAQSTDRILATLHYYQIENRARLNAISNLLVQNILPKLDIIQAEVAASSRRLDEVLGISSEISAYNKMEARRTARSERAQIKRPPEDAVTELFVYANSTSLDSRLTGNNWVGLSDIASEIQQRAIAPNLIFSRIENAGSYSAVAGYLREIVIQRLRVAGTPSATLDKVPSARNAEEYLYGLSEILAAIEQNQELLEDRKLQLQELRRSGRDIVELRQFFASTEVVRTLFANLSSAGKDVQLELQALLSDSRLKAAFGIPPQLDLERPLSTMSCAPTEISAGIEQTTLRYHNLDPQNFYIQNPKEKNPDFPNPWDEAKGLFSTAKHGPHNISDAELVYWRAFEWWHKTPAWLPAARLSKLVSPDKYADLETDNNTGDHKFIGELHKNFSPFPLGRAVYNPFLRAVALNAVAYSLTSQIDAISDFNRKRLQVDCNFRARFVEQNVAARDERRLLGTYERTFGGRREGPPPETETVEVFDIFRVFVVDGRPQFVAELSSKSLLAPDGSALPALRVTATAQDRVAMGTFWRESWGGIWDFKANNRAKPSALISQMAQNTPADSLTLNLYSAQAQSITSTFRGLDDVLRMVIPQIQVHASYSPYNINPSTDWLWDIELRYGASTAGGELGIHVTCNYLIDPWKQVAAQSAQRGQNIPFEQRVASSQANPPEKRTIQFELNRDVCEKIRAKLDPFNGTLKIESCPDIGMAIEMLLSHEAAMCSLQSRLITGRSSAQPADHSAKIERRNDRVEGSVLRTSITEGTELRRKLELFTSHAQLLYAVMDEAASEVLSEVLSRSNRNHAALQLIRFGKIELDELQGAHPALKLMERLAPLGTAAALDMVDSRLREAESELNAVIDEYLSAICGESELGTARFRDAIQTLEKMVEN